MGASLKHERADGLVRGRLATQEIITATIPEFRRLTGISRSRTYELLEAGEIESIHIGSRRLILMESFHRLIERRRAAAQTVASQAPRLASRRTGD